MTINFEQELLETIIEDAIEPTGRLFESTDILRHKEGDRRHYKIEYFLGERSGRIHMSALGDPTVRTTRHWTEMEKVA